MKKELTEQQINMKRDMKRKQKYSSITRKYNKMLWLRQEKIKAKQEKELDRIWKKRQKLRDIELHNLTAKRKKKIPTKPDTPKARQEAYTTFQLWRRMNLADKDWMVLLTDKLTKVHYTKCVAWHIYSKVNHPNLAFEPMNVRCITNETNRKQWTSPWIFRAVNVLSWFWLDNLKKLSEDKSRKSEKRDWNYYRSITETYNELIEIEKKRLWL